MAGNVIRNMYAFTPDDVQFPTHFKGASCNRFEAVLRNLSIPTLTSNMDIAKHLLIYLQLECFSLILHLVFICAKLELNLQGLRKTPPYSL